MKKIIAAVILSVAVVRLSGAYDLSTAGENRVFYKNVLQKIRIEKYDKFSKDYEEKKAQCDKTAMQAVPEKLAQLEPNAQTVLKNRLQRETKRMEAAKKELDDHKATMTEEDFAAIAARDKAIADEAARVEAKKAAIKEKAQRKREAKWNKRKNSVQ